MHTTPGPSFPLIAAYLAGAVGGFALLASLVQLMLIYGVADATVLAWLIFWMSCGTVAYCCTGIVLSLFPAWLRAGSSGRLVREVIEIEETV